MFFKIQLFFLCILYILFYISFTLHYYSLLIIYHFFLKINSSLSFVIKFILFKIYLNKFYIYKTNNLILFIFLKISFAIIIIIMLYA